MSRRLFRSLIILGGLAIGAMAHPADVLAQRAVPRPPVHGHYRPVYYRPVYYRPAYYPGYYYSPFYWGIGFGFGYGWYPPYYWYPQYPAPYWRHENREVAARIEVTPRDAEVFIDGYLVGVVDNFDGTFQRLHLRAGEHTLEIFKEGYRTIRERVDFKPGDTYRVKFTMEPLGSGEPQPARPKPDPSAPRSHDPDARRPDAPEPPRPPMSPEPARAPVRGEGGALALRVQPEGAVVLVNGERWVPPAGPEPLVIHLEEGTHRIEVQKEGYRAYSAEIRVRRGETVPLNISLRVER